MAGTVTRWRPNVVPGARLAALTTESKQLGERALFDRGQTESRARLDELRALLAADQEAQKRYAELVAVQLAALDEQVRLVGEQEKLTGDLLRETFNDLDGRITADLNAVRAAGAELSLALVILHNQIMTEIGARLTWKKSAGGIADNSWPSSGYPALTGEIRLIVGGVAPFGWLHCDGQFVPIANYGPLYAVLGGTFDVIQGEPSPPAGMFRVPRKNQLTSDPVLLTGSTAWMFRYIIRC